MNVSNVFWRHVAATTDYVATNQLPIRTRATFQRSKRNHGTEAVGTLSGVPRVRGRLVCRATVYPPNPTPPHCTGIQNLSDGSKARELNMDLKPITSIMIFSDHNLLMRFQLSVRGEAEGLDKCD